MGDAVSWLVLNIIAEEKIREAMDNGEFDNLEGKGKPLVFEDDSMVPPELRLAYKLLRNSGHAPPEVQTEKEISNIKELLANSDDERERVAQIQKLNMLVGKLNMSRRRPVNMEASEVYYERVVEKVSVNTRKDGAGQSNGKGADQSEKTGSGQAGKT